MNKRHIVASLNNIAFTLDKLNLFQEADAITKVMNRLASSESDYDQMRKYQELFDQKSLSELLNDLKRVIDDINIKLENDTKTHLENKFKKFKLNNPEATYEDFQKASVFNRPRIGYKNPIDELVEKYDINDNSSVNQFNQFESELMKEIGRGFYSLPFEFDGLSFDGTKYNLTFLFDMIRKKLRNNPEVLPFNDVPLPPTEGEDSEEDVSNLLEWARNPYEKKTI